MLEILPVKTQEHHRKSLSHCEQIIGRNLVLKDITAEGKEGSEEVGVWRKAHTCYNIAGSSVTLSPAVNGKQNSQAMNLKTQLRRFPSKGLEVLLGVLLLLRVKCDRREVN